MSQTHRPIATASAPKAPAFENQPSSDQTTSIGSAQSGTDSTMVEKQAVATVRGLGLLSGEAARENLLRQLPLDILSKTWTAKSGLKLLKPEKINSAIHASIGDRKDVFVSITHDDYLQSAGGVQLCAQLEQISVAAKDRLHINLFPALPSPILSSNADPQEYEFSMFIEGTRIGRVRAKDVASALASTETLCVSEVAIHSLHGHNVEIIKSLLDQWAPSSVFFWVHDFFSVCENHLLLRNGTNYCQAPGVGSLSCQLCVHGSRRSNHLKQIRQLFEAVRPIVVAPSKPALDIWSSSTDLPHSAAHVVEHVTLEPSTQKAAQKARSQNEPLRIAFLGHQVSHKGWPAFVDLAHNLQSSGDFSFYHFGSGDQRVKGINFKSVHTTHGNSTAMIDSLVDNDIDVVFCWSIWPETFSFTLYESLAAGATILTNQASGNVAAVAQQRDDCYVADSLAHAEEILTGDVLKSAVLKKRAEGTQLFNLAYSDMSAQLIQR